MRSTSLGLRARLILLVLVAVIPAFGLIGYTAVNQRQQAMVEAERNAQSLVRLTVQQQDQLIAMTRQLLLSLAQLPSVRGAGDAAACSRVLAGLHEAYPYYTNLGVATRDGRVFCSALPLKQSVNIDDRSYFRRVLQVRDFAVGEYQVGRISGLPAINFGYPMLDASGRVQAVVFAGLNLSWINQLLSSIELPAGSILTVVDGRGTVLAHQPDPEPWVGKSMGSDDFVRTMLANVDEHFTEHDDANGLTRFYVVAPLHRGLSGTVYVSVSIPKAAVLAAANRDFVRDLVLFVLVATLALVAAWVGGDVFVLRRIRVLADAARRLGTGDLDARTGLPHDREEIGQLAHRFDDMAAALQRVNRTLKTLSAGNRTLVRAADEQSLLAEMCRTIVGVGSYRLAWVGYAEQDGQRSVRAVAQAGFRDGLEALADTLGTVTWDDSERGRGPAGTTIRTAKPYVARRLLSEPGFAPWREVAMRHGYGACASFPLPLNGCVIGALTIYAGEADAFDPQELGLLAEMAEDLAFGIATQRTRAEHEAANATIRHMAHYDRLTGLPNHLYLEDHAQREITAAPGRPLALLLLDIDRLREINSALGFDQGDRLIQNVGQRLAGLRKGAETVARMRADEFAMLLPGSDAARATRAALEMMSALEAPFALGDLKLHISTSVGIAVFPQHGADAAHLVRHVDVAMRRAKKSGAHYAIYEPNPDEENPRRLALASELRNAIDNDELVLYYQPKIDLNSGRACGAEALVRWRHPRDGMIPPDEFVPLAEHTGLIKPMTDWVLAAALRQSSAWREAGLQLPIAVNLSARNLRDPELFDRIEKLFVAWGVDPGRLEVEITESAMMEDPEGALEVLSQLRGLGIRLYIDDFGTGHSSLAYLKRLPMHAVKIDKSFVSDMLTNGDSDAIVRSTITLAHDIGLKVVAEGVENEAMRERLVALGCDTGQGYHFSKPLPPQQFEEWLNTHPSAPQTDKRTNRARRRSSRAAGRNAG